MIDPTPAIRAVAPDADAPAWAAAFAAAMPKYGITTSRRIAALIGQCSVETGGFAELVENMNYSADRLVAVFPTHFRGLNEAVGYQHQPERIANRVYADRLGNGPEGSGDGWTFRGAGALQTTGRDAFTALAKALGRPSPEECAAWVATIEGAAVAACWDWCCMGCNGLADGWEISKLSRTINGGTMALAARIDACNTALLALEAAGHNPTLGARVVAVSPVARPVGVGAPVLSVVTTRPIPVVSDAQSTDDDAETADELDARLNPSISFT